MEFKQIQELIKVINKSNLEKVKIKDGDFEITIKQHSNQETPVVTYTAPAPMVQAQPAVQAVAAPQTQAPETAAPTPPADAPAAEEAASNTIVIKSPMIGTFYRSPSPDKPPFVGIGDNVKSGDVVCIIEAMKLFNEIESEVSGKIVKVLVDDATPVEYDQPLFLVEP